MIQHHVDFSLIRCPKSWGTPEFQLGDRVLVRRLSKERENAGTVIGFEFVERANHDDWTEEDLGWWYFVLLDEDAADYFFEPIGCYSPDAMRHLLPVVELCHAELIPA